jgi:hypothetical protein
MTARARPKPTAAPAPAAPANDLTTRAASDAGTDAAADLGADGGPRLYGAFDVIRPDRIGGWVIDRTDARAAVEVDVVREGRVLATLRAERLRKDLERRGVGTGRYGFGCEIAPPLEPGFEFTLVAVARAGDGARAELRPSRAAAAPEHDRRLLERIFEDLQALRAAPPAPAPLEDAAAAAIEGLHELIGRLELAQIRVEAALAAVEPPAAPPQAGLRALVLLALAAGLGSLAIGVVSMLGP